MRAARLPRRAAQQGGDIGFQKSLRVAKQAEIVIRLLAAQKLRDAQRAIAEQAERQQGHGLALGVAGENEEGLDAAAINLQPVQQEGRRLVIGAIGFRRQRTGGGQRGAGVAENLDLGESLGVQGHGGGHFSKKGSMQTC